MVAIIVAMQCYQGRDEVFPISHDSTSPCKSNQALQNAFNLSKRKSIKDNDSMEILVAKTRGNKMNYTIPQIPIVPLEAA